VEDSGTQKRVSVAELLSSAARVLREDFRQLGLIPQSASSGLSREELLRRFLNEHLPRRFAAASGFVVDGTGSVSRQTDIIVYDALNAPVYQNAFNSLIVGRDTVAAFIEVKSRLRSEHLRNAAEATSLIKSMVQQLRPLKRVLLKEGSEEKLLEGDAPEPLSVLFAYESDLSLESICREWAEMYSTVEFGTQLGAVVVLDKGVVHLAAWHPGIGMPEHGLLPVLALPVLRQQGATPASRLIFPRIKGDDVEIHLGSATSFPPGSRFYMTFEALGERTLDWFFRALLQQLSFYAQLCDPGISHFSGDRTPPTHVEPLGVCVEIDGASLAPASRAAVVERLKQLLS
jgi:hypothetical protein